MLQQTLKTVPHPDNPLWSVLHVVLFLERTGSFYQVAANTSTEGAKTAAGVFWPPVAAVQQAQKARLEKELKDYLDRGPFAVKPLKRTRR